MPKPIRTMTTAILTSARARDSLQSQNQKRAAFGVGCEGDTSPLGGLLSSTARLACGNLLKTETMNGKTRLGSAFFALPQGNLLNLRV